MSDWANVECTTWNCSAATVLLYLNLLQKKPVYTLISSGGLESTTLRTLHLQTRLTEPPIIPAILSRSFSCLCFLERNKSVLSLSYPDSMAMIIFCNSCDDKLRRRSFFLFATTASLFMARLLLLLFSRRIEVALVVGSLFKFQKDTKCPGPCICNVCLPQLMAADWKMGYLL